MTPQEVATSYDAIADRWASEGFSREYGIEQHKRALGFSENRGKALDVGCGSSGRLLDLMISEGFEPEGVDISQRMLGLARQRHPEITFYHEDICEWEIRGKYDFISAWDSIWHIPLEDHQQVLTKLLGALSPDGVLIFSTGGVDSPSETRDSAMGPPMYHSAPGIPRILEWIAQSGCVCRHLEYDQFPELHMYIIVQKSSVG